MFHRAPDKTHSWIASLLVLALLSAGTASAAPPKKQAGGPEGIPKAPSAPPLLSRRVPVDSFRCQRRLLYNGKALNCDSNLGRDGEGLRPILEETPAALSELNEYQLNRARLQNAAYVGSAGVGLAVVGAIAGYFIGGLPGARVRTIGVAAGLLTLVGSASYSLLLIKKNEAHLGNAVRYHNDAHPDHPIELQFSTDFGFFENLFWSSIKTDGGSGK